ncbi:MAG TPA: gliding motility-associated protein GldE [Chitinophagaceae bacterium]|mgnify:CR=1 FL=1|nr:gliding motility-associated protein GldE [Chitinophagaceae bacterium]
MDIHSVIPGLIPEYCFTILSATVQTTTLLVALLVVLLLLTFTISGAEVAIFSLNNRDVNMLKTKQHPAARRIIQFLDEPKEVFASLLIASIFINISIIILANFLVSEYLPYGSLGLFGKSSWNYVFEVFLRAAIIGSGLVFFGEILPKVWATQNNLRFAYGSAVIVEGIHLLLHRISRWMVSLAEKIGNKTGANKSEAVSIQELNEAIDIKTDEEASPEEKNIMKGIVKFGSITVKQVMRSRLEVNGISNQSDFAGVIEKVRELNHSRLPVYRNSMDEVIGIINTKDLTPHLQEPAGFDWQPLMRQPFFVPESRLIADLLLDFQNRRTHFAVVVDEFGGTSGIVTMEDIMEEVIGEIRDEFDKEESRDRKLDDNNFLFEGRTMIHDMCKAMHLPMSTFDKVRGESESVGGLVLELAGEFPRINDVVTSGDFEFTVLEVENNRLLLIKVSIKEREK